MFIFSNKKKKVIMPVGNSGHQRIDDVSTILISIFHNMWIHLHLSCRKTQIL